MLMSHRGLIITSTARQVSRRNCFDLSLHTIERVACGKLQNERLLSAKNLLLFKKLLSNKTNWSGPKLQRLAMCLTYNLSDRRYLKNIFFFCPSQNSSGAF